MSWNNRLAKESTGISLLEMFRVDRRRSVTIDTFISLARPGRASFNRATIICCSNNIESNRVRRATGSDIRWRRRCFLGRWSEIQLSFPERSCYTLQNRWRKLTQFRQIDELFASQSVRCSFLLLHLSPPCFFLSFSLVVSSIVSSSAILRSQSSSPSTDARSTTLFNLSAVLSSILWANLVFFFAGHCSSPGDSPTPQSDARMEYSRASERDFSRDQISTKEIESFLLFDE